jgi:hypothetical protein
LKICDIARTGCMVHVVLEFSVMMQKIINICNYSSLMANHLGLMDEIVSFD